MHTPPLLVNDLELLVAQIVKFILLVIILVSVFINLRRISRYKNITQIFWQSTIVFILILTSLPVIKWIQIDGALLSSSQFAQGRTIEICQVFAQGKGIAFEYDVLGKKYFGCKTFHPLELEDIKVLEGYYHVR